MCKFARIYARVFALCNLRVQCVGVGMRECVRECVRVVYFDFL